MAEPTRPGPTALGQALGRIPSGLYILTVRDGDRATGMLASWVQQAGFDPPMITLAVQRDRFAADWIDRSGRLTLNQLATGSKALIRHFSRGFEPDAPAFEGIETRDGAEGGPILAGALAFLDVVVAGSLAEGDHRIFLARVVAGGLIASDAEPFVHVRAHGFHY